MIKRRDFLTQSIQLTAGATILRRLPKSGLFAPSTKIAPSDKLRFGLIGCKGMGWSNLQAHLKIPQTECIALCDVDKNVLDQRNGELEKLTGKKAIAYGDYRKLLENKDIDHVIIGTPDHWHALMMINACEAGKDVYVEKPLGRTIEECNIMLAAARKYNRVVQVGQWQRSNQHWKDATDFVQSGKLGKIRLVKTWAYQGWMKTVLKKPDSPVPAGVDYDMWLGPAPKRPFNENRFHFNFRWYWDYAGGLMTDWGVHIIDMALLGMKAQGPKSVMAIGGNSDPNSAMETPDTLQALYEFDGYNMIWEHANGVDGGPYGRNHGVGFIGNLGTLVVDREGWEVIPEKGRMEAIALQKRSDDGLLNHHKNFIECMQSRARPACDIAFAHNTALNASLGNIALRVGRRISWDAAKQQIVDDSKAHNLTKANYQNGWKTPTV